MKARWIKDDKYEVVVIYCPGCRDRHYLRVANEGVDRPAWQFNGDMNNPTFSPSLLIRTGKYVIPDYKEEREGESVICHSFIKEGTIQYFGDCTHHLKNQTVELPDVNTPLPYE